MKVNYCWLLVFAINGVTWVVTYDFAWFDNEVFLLWSLCKCIAVYIRLLINISQKDWPITANLLCWTVKVRYSGHLAQEANVPAYRYGFDLDTYLPKMRSGTDRRLLSFLALFTPQPKDGPAQITMTSLGTAVRSADFATKLSSHLTQQQSQKLCDLIHLWVQDFRPFQVESIDFLDFIDCGCCSTVSVGILLFAPVRANAVCFLNNGLHRSMGNLVELTNMFVTTKRYSPLRTIRQIGRLATN